MSETLGSPYRHSLRSGRQVRVGLSVHTKLRDIVSDLAFYEATPTDPEPIRLRRPV